MIYMNRLDNEEEISKFKAHLETRATRSLEHFIRLYERDLKLNSQHYVKHDLRIKLVNEEINKRSN